MVSSSSSAIPDLSRATPMKTNSGTASRVKFVIVPQIRMGRMLMKSGWRKPKATPSPPKSSPVKMRLKGNLVWRHVAGAQILRKPEVNDRDIFIAPERLGLRKLYRFSGREVLTNREVEKFLAANQSFVYALDRLGNFFVLDAKRGTTLAKHDLTEWAISVPNEYTDRIYLAANDGQILCLRHRDMTKPVIMKTVEEYKHMDDKKKDEKKENGQEKGALDVDRLPALTWGKASALPEASFPTRALR